MAKYEDTASIEIKENEGLSLDFDGTDLFARIEILSRYQLKLLWLPKKVMVICLWIW